MAQPRSSSTSAPWGRANPAANIVSVDHYPEDVPFALDAGQSYSYGFDDSGSFDYLCTPHFSMKAAIDIVE